MQRGVTSSVIFRQHLSFVDEDGKLHVWVGEMRSDHHFNKGKDGFMIRVVLLYRQSGSHDADYMSSPACP